MVMIVVIVMVKHFFESPTMVDGRESESARTRDRERWRLGEMRVYWSPYESDISFIANVDGFCRGKAIKTNSLKLIHLAV